MEFLDKQHSDLNNKRNNFLKAYPHRIVYVSIEGLKVKIKPVNTGKKFQSRGVAVIVTHLTLFRLLESLNERLEKIVSERDFLPQFTHVDGILIDKLNLQLLRKGFTMSKQIVISCIFLKFWQSQESKQSIKKR